MQRIMIVEDEEAMRLGLADLLRSAGYEPVGLDLFGGTFIEPTAPPHEARPADSANPTASPLASPSLSDFITKIISAKPNLILLDINLPAINGELLLKGLRQQTNIPVIMVTSSSTEMDEVLSMSYGADDYITKPYSPQILLLRIAAVLKRMEQPSSPIKYRGLEIDLTRGVLSNSTKHLQLTKNEMIIMNHLLKQQGRIVTRDALMTDLWNNHEYINDNALTVNVSRVRAKLKNLGVGDAIETRKGLGYILQ